MNVRNGPMFVKTYGRHMRKVEPWFSPDLKKAAFSFSTSVSSDQSFTESKQPKKRKLSDQASRPAKSRAKTALKESESDEENCDPSLLFGQKKKSSKPLRSTARKKTPRATKKAGKRNPVVRRIREKGDLLRRQKISEELDASLKTESETSRFRFVTKRKRPNIQKLKPNRKPSVALQRTLDSSDDFFPSRSKNNKRVRRKPLCIKSPDAHKPVLLSERNLHVVLNNGTFNDELQLCGKRPLLSSTPSVICRQLQPLPEPSISEISSLSFEDHRKDIWQSISKTEGSPQGQRSEPKSDRAEADAEEPQTGSGFTSAGHVEILLKERCLKSKVFVVLEDLNSLEYQSVGIKESSPTHTVSVASSNQLLHSSLSSPEHLPPPAESLSSLAALTERLKSASLLTGLTVRIQRLDLKLLQEKTNNSWNISPRASPSSPPQKSECCNDISIKENLVRRLSDSFQPPPVPLLSPATQSNGDKHFVPKSAVASGRRVCVSGLNVSRWSKKGLKINEKHRKKDRGCKDNFWSSGVTSLRANTFTGESVCEWLPGTSDVDLAVTPLRMEGMNISSFLANFTPDRLSTHSWGRLKAALSLHKKKTAFRSPSRLGQSQLSITGIQADASLDLFQSPVCSRLSSHASSRLLHSSVRTPGSSYYEDISDAEKVFHECHQTGPITFSACIPASRMQLCSKIGEGTFGEVFSTINDAGQTVALKIIPLEGSQLVNGEQQKMFGEILHEIIISKELSCLNVKEQNKTDGFIGLNNLHCVQGRYPDALLKAWDKFDRQRRSENDRPDFFRDDQFFLILEFEFGGSDLENMNRKLSSMAQAKSILHQVTAALAVAEQALSFEHRDLHWGNILVKNTKQQQTEFLINGAVHNIQTQGVHVNIIDYSLSRLEIDGLTVSCDISTDEELFMGQGDYQFEVYRLMKRENDNCWSSYNPHSNVLWLHYLVEKLLSMSYKSKARSGQQRALKNQLQSFHREILAFPSATDALLNSTLFR